MRCLLNETFDDTDSLARASLPRRLPGLVVIVRVGLGLEAPSLVLWWLKSGSPVPCRADECRRRILGARGPQSVC